MPKFEAEKFSSIRYMKNLKQPIILILIFALSICATGWAQKKNNLPSAEKLYERYRIYSYARYKKMLRRVLEAKENAAKTHGTQSPQYLKVFDLLADFYYKSGQYPEALPYFSERVVRVEKAKGQNHPEYGVALSNLANIYKAIGQYAKAEPLYIKSLEIGAKTTGDARLGYATSLNGLADLYKKLGQYAKAEQNYLKSQQIIQSIKGKAHILYANSLNDFANLYFEQGRYKKAKSLYQQNLKTAVSTLKQNPQFHVTILNQLGKISMLEKRYLEAESLFNLAREKSRKILGRYHPDFAESMFNQAVLYKNHPKSNYRYQKFENTPVEYSYLHESKRIRKKVLGVSHPDYVASVDAMADLYEKRGNFAKAEKLYLEAVTIKLEEFKRNKFILSEKGQKAYLKRNEVFFNNFRRLVIDRATERWLSAGRRGQLAKKLFDVEAILKAQLLDGRQRLHHLIMQKAAVDAVIREKYALYKKLKTQVAKSINQFNSGGINIARYIQRIDTLEKQLYAVAGANEVFYGFDTIRNQLRDEEAIVEIIKQKTWRRRAISNKKILNPVRFLKNQVRSTRSIFKKEDRSFLPVYIMLIASKKSKYPKMIFIKDKYLENRHAKEYRKAILAQKKDYKSYQRYWYAVGKYLKKKKIKKVFVSPAGIYNRININTLYNSKTNKYAGEELDIQAITTSRDVVKNRIKGQNLQNKINQQVILIGRPRYNMSLADLHKKEQSFTKAQQSGFVDMDFPPTSNQVLTRGKRGLRNGWADLPGTEAEVKTIAQVLKQKNNLQVKTLLGEEALELALKNVNHPKILHIATHGFFLESFKTQAPPKKLEKKKISFARGGTESRAFFAQVTKMAREDPMLRSGIVLAGVSSYASASKKPNIEDGVLTAYEASQMDLRGTELVVLSACETGLGDIDSGEGVYGLQRAFVVAGAKTVILSLWKVDDNATKILMSKFYEEWIKNGKTKRTAFKTAQAYLRANGYAAPYYWGAFRMVGVED